MSTEGYKIRKNSPPLTIREFVFRLKELGYRPNTARDLGIAAGKYLRYCAVRSAKPCKQMTEEFLSVMEEKLTHRFFNSVREGVIKYEFFLAGKEIPHMVVQKSRAKRFYEGIFLKSALQEFLSETGKSIRPDTLETKRKNLTDFLIFCNGELTSENILASLRGRGKEFRAHVRQFLAFCFRQGHIKKDYATIIISEKRPKRLPSVYSEEEISKAVDYHSCRAPLRDRAIMLLIATTGIRSSDVVSLKREDVDTEAKRLSIIQKKTGVPLSLPLSDDVVEAVSDYVENERPDSNSEFLFLASVYPFGKLGTGSIRYLVARNFSKTGTDISARKHGPHSLRSSLASALVAEGMSLELTRKALGHSDQSSLNRYVKLDRERLREYALPVPKPQGRFAEWLKEAGK